MSKTLQSWLTMLAALVLTCSGCVATPQPDPPNVIDIDGDLLSIAPTNSFGPLEIAGGPGSITPPEADLRVWNFDLPEPPWVISPEPDGSFRHELWVNSGNELRLQAFLEGDPSRPLDLVVIDEETLAPAPRPLADCLTTEPTHTLEVHPGTAANATVLNGCESAVTISAIALRQPSIFTASGELGELEGGSNQTIAVEATELQPEAIEILLIEITAPDADRRAITLMSSSP